jgi:hypothetical protein
MNVVEFQKKWGADFQAWLKSPMATDLFELLQGCEMIPSINQQDHQMAFTLGGIAGRREVLFQMKSLAVIKQPRVEPDQNYGHPEPEPKKKTE